MTTTPVRESRRYAFPPLWLVPILLVAAIVGWVLVSFRLGVLGIPLALYGVYWLQHKADAYARTRTSS